MGKREREKMARKEAREEMGAQRIRRREYRGPGEESIEDPEKRAQRIRRREHERG